jgi:hypothetical protein
MRACCAGGSSGRSAGNAIGGGVWFGESHCKTFGAGTSAPNEKAHAKLAASAMAALGGKLKVSAALIRRDRYQCYRGDGLYHHGFNARLAWVRSV